MQALQALLLFSHFSHSLDVYVMYVLCDCCVYITPVYVVFVSIYGVQWLSRSQCYCKRKMAGLEAKETPQTHCYVMVTLLARGCPYARRAGLAGLAVLAIDELKTPTLHSSPQLSASRSPVRAERLSRPSPTALLLCSDVCERRVMLSLCKRATDSQRSISNGSTLYQHRYQRFSPSH